MINTTKVSRAVNSGITNTPELRSKQAQYADDYALCVKIIHSDIDGNDAAEYIAAFRDVKWGLDNGMA